MSIQCLLCVEFAAITSLSMWLVYSFLPNVRSRIGKSGGTLIPCDPLHAKENDDNNDNDVMYDTRVPNLSVQFIEACCMS